MSRNKGRAIAAQLNQESDNIFSLSGPALVAGETQMEEKVTVLRVLQEHSMGASGTGQSEQLSGRTHAWKWSQMYPIKQREPGPGPDIPQACAANQQYGGLASSPCYAHS